MYIHKHIGRRWLMAERLPAGYTSGRMNAASPRLIYRLWDFVFRVRPDEFARVQALLGFLTTVTIFWTIGSTVGDTLFLSHLGVEGALTYLPWLFVGTAFATVLVTVLYDALQSLVPRTTLLLALFLALAVSIVAFRRFVTAGPAWMYLALAIWLETCGILCVTLFFSTAGDYFTSRDARRLYGYINGGMALGTLLGGYAVQPLVRTIGVHNLLLVCAGLLAASAGWVLVLRTLTLFRTDRVEAELAALERAAHRQSEGVKIQPLEAFSEEPGAPLLQEHLGARHVVGRQVMEAHRHLDQTLQRLLLRALSAQPERLQQLVDFEVEASVEEGRGLVERLAQGEIVA
jgi:ATP/ADP translocase